MIEFFADLGIGFLGLIVILWLAAITYMGIKAVQNMIREKNERQKNH